MLEILDIRQKSAVWASLMKFGRNIPRTSRHRSCEFDSPVPKTRGVTGLQIFGKIFPLKKVPFGVPPRSRFRRPFLFGRSHCVQRRWPRTDRPSFGKVMGPEKFGGFFPLKKLPFAVPAESWRWQSIFPVCEAEFNKLDRVRKSFSVPEILIRVENGLFLACTKIQKFISGKALVRFFLFSNIICPPSPSFEIERLFSAELPRGGSRGQNMVFAISRKRFEIFPKFQNCPLGLQKWWLFAIYTIWRKCLLSPQNWLRNVNFYPKNHLGAIFSKLAN